MAWYGPLRFWYEGFYCNHHIQLKVVDWEYFKFSLNFCQLFDKITIKFNNLLLSLSQMYEQEHMHHSHKTFTQTYIATIPFFLSLSQFQSGVILKHNTCYETNALY